MPGNHYYDVFINAMHFCRLAGTDVKEAKQEAEKVMKREKEKFIYEGSSRGRAIDQQTMRVIEGLVKEGEEEG